MSFSRFKLHNSNNNDKSSFFTKYASQSSIHGVKYLLIENEAPYTVKTYLKRFIWILILFISFICFIKLSISIGQLWNTEPTIIGVHRRPEPIWNIPFPAITICPETKAKRTVFDFTDAYHQMADMDSATFNLNDEKLATLGSLLHVCDSHLSESWLLPNATERRNGIYNDIRKISPSRSEIIQYCNFRGQFSFCSSNFSDVWTSDGLCFTFNILNSSDIFTNKFSSQYPTINHNLSEHGWTVESGYKSIKDYHYNMYPYRAASSGLIGGISVLLQQNISNFEYICRGPTNGYKVMLHRPDELPDPTNHYFRVSHETELLITVKPYIFKMSEDLRSLDPKIRNCYFQSESKLQYFKHYSVQNCKRECIANYINIQCGCATFAFPLNNNIRSCGAKDISCTSEAFKQFHNESFIEGILKTVNQNLNCNCLPACNSIEYEGESSQTPLEFNNLLSAYKVSSENGTKFSRFAVLFKDHTFTPVEHIVINRSNTEMIALIGGLLALFFGASILSIFEFFYILIMHLMTRKELSDKNGVNYNDGLSPLEDELRT